MKNEKFNQTQYINAWKKEHKKQFKVELNIDEYEELEELLKKYNLTKVNFVRKSMRILKEDNMKFVEENNIIKNEEDNKMKYVVILNTDYIDGGNGGKYEGYHINNISCNNSEVLKVFDDYNEALEYFNNYKLYFEEGSDYQDWLELGKITDDDSCCSFDYEGEEYYYETIYDRYSYEADYSTGKITESSYINQVYDK